MPSEAGPCPDVGMSVHASTVWNAHSCNSTVQLPLLVTVYGMVKVVPASSSTMWSHTIPPVHVDGPNAAGAAVQTKSLPVSLIPLQGSALATAAARPAGAGGIDLGKIDARG